LAALVSLLWLVVEVTPVWIITYIVTLLAILLIALGYAAYGKKSAGAVQGHAYFVSSLVYALTSAIFSAITLIYDQFFRATYPPPWTTWTTWYLIIHAVIFFSFVIRILAIFGALDHVEKVGAEAEEKHKELNKDKANYW
jgi:uncharacterized membrane protein